MKRRDLLKAISAGGALLAAAVLGGSVPVVACLHEAAGRAARVPHDILARIRRRTRPLDPTRLDTDHDLAG